MARTTLDLADPVLRDLKRLQKKENKSMGELASELLAEGLAARASEVIPRKLRWKSTPMGLKVDLSDRDSVYAILDSE